MGRPSKLTPDDMPKASMVWDSLLVRLQMAVNTEDSALDQVRLLLLTGQLHLVLESRPISGHTFEFSLGRHGVVDLLLQHTDGSYTVVEGKSPARTREAVHGIGQLFMYEAGLRLRLESEGVLTPTIHKVLCACVDGERAADLWEICALAGVRLMPLVRSEHVRRVAAEVGGHHGN